MAWRRAADELAQEVNDEQSDSVVRSIRAFEASAVQELIHEFERHDAFHGRRIELISGSKRISGINRGITSEGQLRLETERGIEVHSAAEISLRAIVE